MSAVAGAGLAVRRDHPWVLEQRRALRFGLAWAPFPDPDWATGRDLVQMAEALGYDSYWCMDHPTHAVDCEPFSFAGAHQRVQEAVIPAGPVQRPHVPILIAGGGERVTLLTIVAPSAAAARRKRGAITFGPRLREAMGTSTVCGTPDDLVRFYRPVLAAGISYLVFGVFHNDVETVCRLADEVMPALRADWRSPVPWAPQADGPAADVGRGAEPVPLGADR